MEGARARLLLIREVRRPTGGNIKVRDYFSHAAAHPGVDAKVWFAPGSRHAETGLWDDLPADRIAPRLDFSGVRFVCVNGKDWSFLPPAGPPAEVIHFVQHAGYLDDPLLRGYLQRPARRICTSPALLAAIAPLANGPASVVPIGVANAFFASPEAPRPRVTVAGVKQPAFAARLCARLAALGVEPILLDDWSRSHAEIAAIVRESRVLVTLPNPVEGFYLPALEGMAAGAAVICADAGGNRAHCIDETTCLQPPFGDLDAHVDAVMRLLGDAPLRRRLARAGREIAAGHTLAAERAAFHAVLDAALAAAA